MIIIHNVIILLCAWPKTRYVLLFVVYTHSDGLVGAERAGCQHRRQHEKRRKRFSFNFVFVLYILIMFFHSFDGHAVSFLTNLYYAPAAGTLAHIDGRTNVSVVESHFINTRYARTIFQDA